MQGKSSKRDHRERTIGLIIYPGRSGAGTHPVSNLIEILSTLIHKQIPLVAGGTLRVLESDARVQYCTVDYNSGNNFMSRTLRFIEIQVRVAQYIAKLSHVDTWMFFIGGELFALPMVTAKLFRKRTIILLPGSAITASGASGSRFVAILKVSSMVVRKLCEKVVVYSPILISEWNLEPYRHKICIAHEHFLDFTTFTVTTPLASRLPLIGYIGRLSGEKGVQHFAQALPAILADRPDLRALIGGDGALKETIAASLQEGGVTARVDLPGWISHNDLPGYLNQLQLLVLPSYTEGLPNIILEAMACGTPVLATPVGAIPDVIIDGKTGFIMENNSPECIAENVIRALNSLDLERIAEEGRRFVEENFTFEKTVEKWKEVFQSME
jgi:glycosyltransferase involved in cell wall biosynthesis